MGKARKHTVIHGNVEKLTNIREVHGDVFISGQKSARPHFASVPPYPSLIVGREKVLRELKTRLGVGTETRTARLPFQVLTAIRGWPGVGKTTVVSAIAHDPEVISAFPDGILWVSLGQHPDLLSELARWGQTLGASDFSGIRSVAKATKRLAGILRDKHALLIVDDIWNSNDALVFEVGGRECATLITTRETSIAHELAPLPDAVYVLPILTDEQSLELLRNLAPTVVANYSVECLELVQELQGLPLALQVAGRLLNAEINYGFGVSDLLRELHDGVTLLKSKAPSDLADLATQTTPTIAVLLQKSTDRLDEQTRRYFSFLGAFAPKPAYFDLAAMQGVWKVDAPKPIVRQLVDRGLLEFVPELNRYQIHALLVTHAKWLCAAT